MNKIRLWRVDVIHINGYHAPYSLIETEIDREYKAEAEAINLAKIDSRLANFNCWNFIATNLHYKKLDDKWYSEDEYLYKIQKRNKRKL